MAETVKLNSAEEVKEFAARNGIEIDNAAAESVFKDIKKNGALSDDDLGGVSGGMSVRDMYAAVDKYRK